MRASEWVQFRFGSKLLTDEWAVECEIADSLAWAVECPPYRGGGGTSPGDNFDRKTSSGDNFVTPPILVRGHQTAEGEFSLGKNFVRWWSTGICPGLQILWRWLNSRTDFFLHFLSLVLMRKLARLFSLRQSVWTQRFCAHLLTI